MRQEQAIGNKKADYVIDVELNDENQTITGSETITYFNNAPEDLKYLWLQLDQNINADGSMTKKLLAAQFVIQFLLKCWQRPQVFSITKVVIASSW